MTRHSLAGLLALLFSLAPIRPASAQEAFLRADVNTDGIISISDSLMLRRFLFSGGTPPSCHDAADFDNSGNLNITDQIRILLYIFNGGPPPAAPFPDVAVDPDEDELPCATYAVSPPQETDDRIRLGEIQAAPGATVQIPVYIKSALSLEAFQLVVSYDPALLTPRSGNQIRDGGVWPDAVFDPAELTAHYFSVDPHPEAGIFTLGFMPSLVGIPGQELPASEEELLAFYVEAEVASTAEPGTTILLEPTNGENGEGFGPAGIVNELTHQGDARFVSLVPAELEGGFVQIVGDQTFFTRADSNGDGIVDVSDPQSTLGFLFLGDAPPACFDAADANDDGKLDIADPVMTLTFLFDNDSIVIPAPYPEPGLDPTDDPIDCFGLTED